MLVRRERASGLSSLFFFLKDTPPPEIYPLPLPDALPIYGVVSSRRWADVDEPRARRLFAEVEAWFASDDAAGPFAFVTICQSLGFDPAYIRRGLRRSYAQVSVRAVRRDATGTRHRVVLPRLGRVA